MELKKIKFVKDHLRKSFFVLDIEHHGRWYPPQSDMFDDKDISFDKIDFVELTKIVNKQENSNYSKAEVTSYFESK